MEKSGFGLAKIKTEGEIADPDDFDWEHDPRDGRCQKCADKYAQWKLKYDAQEKSKTMQDDDDIGAMWRDIKEARQLKRAENRKGSEVLLREAGVVFENKNGGAHLIVRVPNSTTVVDFWPGTGRWTIRGVNKTAFGVRNLLKLCK